LSEYNFTYIDVVNQTAPSGFIQQQYSPTYIFNLESILILHFLHLISIFGISRIPEKYKKYKWIEHLKKYYKWNGWMMLYYLTFTNMILNAALQIKSFDDSTVLNIMVFSIIKNVLYKQIFFI